MKTPSRDDPRDTLETAVSMERFSFFSRLEIHFPYFMHHCLLVHGSNYSTFICATVIYLR